MIEQINIALEQKEVQGISQLGHCDLPSEITSKEAYIGIKSDEEWTSRSSLEQDDIVNSLGHEALQ